MLCTWTTLNVPCLNKQGRLGPAHSPQRLSPMMGLPVGTSSGLGYGSWFGLHYPNRDQTKSRYLPTVIMPLAEWAKVHNFIFPNSGLGEPRERQNSAACLPMEEVEGSSLFQGIFFGKLCPNCQPRRLGEGQKRDLKGKGRGSFSFH